MQKNKDYFVKATQKRNAKLKELDYTLTLEEWEDTKNTLIINVHIVVSL